MEETRIRVATPDDRDPILATIVRAFAADPFLRFMLPDDDDYSAHAPAFFGALFDKRVPAGTVWIAGDADAVALWDGPGASGDVAIELPAAARAVMEEYDHAVHGALPQDRHWYLGVLATDPAHAGRGLGRSVMRSGLARAAAEGLPAYLETTNEGNVALYERAGWRVETELAHPMPIWVMRQDPQG